MLSRQSRREDGIWDVDAILFKDVNVAEPLVEEDMGRAADRILFKAKHGLRAVGAELYRMGQNQLAMKVHRFADDVADARRCLGRAR